MLLLVCLDFFLHLPVVCANRIILLIYVVLDHNFQVRVNNLCVPIHIKVVCPIVEPSLLKEVPNMLLFQHLNLLLSDILSISQCFDALQLCPARLHHLLHQCLREVLAIYYHSKLLWLQSVLMVLQRLQSQLIEVAYQLVILNIFLALYQHKPSDSLNDHVCACRQSSSC
jgi:hypothetical protein